MEHRSNASRAQIQEEVQLALSNLARFTINRATKASLELITTCAVDGDPTWKLFFQEGMADALSEDKELENEFFVKLCDTRGLPYSAEIIDAYMAQMPADRRDALMEATNLKKKRHPVNMSFYKSTFKGKEGEYFLDVFMVFFKYGLDSEKLDIVVSRCFDDLERACTVGNDKFIESVIPKLASIPEELLQRIVSRSHMAEEVITTFVKKCNVPIETFTDSRIMVHARPEVAQFITAFHARNNRLSERVLTQEE